MHTGRAAQMALVLGRLLREDVALERLRALDAAAGAGLEALGGAALGFRLGHCITPVLSWRRATSGGSAFRARTPLLLSRLSRQDAMAGFGSFFTGFAAGFFTSFLPFFGASTMISCRPSIFGYCSTIACGSRSCLTLSINRTPNSWCAISRPRYRSVTLVLSPSSRNLIRLRSLIW